MKKLALSLVSLTFLVLAAGAQNRVDVVDGAYKRTLNPATAKEPIPLPEIQEQDVMFSWTIFRVIDLSQKLN
ncbi:MAG: hypothetical protein ACKOQP_06260, partial [Bacteroidota bacterium]